jgi:glycosyltransferase involved in cell wall biosynthesis
MESNTWSSGLSAPIYLVIPSTGVGGMEKRLVEVWLRLAPQHERLHLIVSHQTYAALLARPDLGDLSALADRVILFDTGSGRWPAMMLALLKVTLSLQRGATVHYLLNAPPLIDRLLGHKMILSWVANYCPRPGRTRAANTIWLAAQAAFFSAHQLDVLNPSVAQCLRRNRFLTQRVSVTAGGSFADFDHFCPHAYKYNDVVFLGPTEACKNALAFVQAIPLIATRLETAGRSARFLVYGEPAGQEAEIARLLASEAYRGIAVERGYTADPAAILAPAKVFVSLQVPSNYPSKALVEAMGCGCVPVINASGESRLMSDDALASYIPTVFSPEELAEAVVGILLMEEQAFSARSSAVRKQAIERFRIERQLEHFADLWDLKRDETSLRKVCITTRFAA